jgi:hypothetical protein
MVNTLSDKLTLHCDNLARIWIKKVRKAENLRTYNALSDDELEKMNSRVYKTLALWFDKEIDKNAIGAFFVSIGKERRKQGFAVSEVSFALFLSQKAVQEYIANENLLDNSMALYTIMGLSSQVADFFYLGSYYMVKGYLEDTFIALHKNEAMSEDRLRKYFSDDFFFKDIDRDHS